MPLSSRSPRRRRRRVWGAWELRAIGMAALTVLLLIVYLGYARPGLLPNHDTTQIRMIADSAHGLSKVGNDVRLNGAVVGAIKSVHRRGDDAELILEIKKSAARDLHQDATAEIRPRFAFEGTGFVDLHRGSPSLPRLAGNLIDRRHTRTYVALDQALKFLRPAVRQDARAVIDDSAAGLPPAAVQHIIKQAPALSSRLAAGMRAAGGTHRRELAGSVAGASRTLRALALQQQSLTALFRGTERTMAAFDVSSGDAIQQTLRGTPPAMAALSSGSHALVRILDQLDPVATRLRPALRELDPALRALDPLLRAAPQSLAATTTVVGRLRRAVSAGAASSHATTSLLQAIQPTAQLLNDKLLPGLAAKTPDLHQPLFRTLMNVLEGGAGAFASFQTPAQAKQPFQVGAGHLVRFDGHFYSGVGAPLPPCTLVEKLGSGLADSLAKAGVCVR
jgi:ABC-type transporter Mla subunit MlaD